MNKASVALLASLALFTNVAGAALDEGSNPPAPATASIPWSELGTRADQQQAPRVPVLSKYQATLAAPLQALNATITPDGLAVDSTSASEGAGRFHLTPVRLDRGGAPVTLTRGTVSTDGNAVILDRGALREVFTASAAGVRQDYIITAPPGGTQLLALMIDVRGATAEQAGDNVVLTLPGGRKLTYHGLLVTDANGKVLEASLDRQDEQTLRITVADADASYPLAIDHTITDDDWSALGSGVRTPGDLHALVVDGAGNLYVGGAFTVAGSVAASHVAKWDGSSWSALGTGVNSTVFSLVLDGAGNLYAGGNFIAAGYVLLNHVAKWDGSSWSALGSGVNRSNVHTLVLDGAGNLYAGGYFTAAGAVTANLVAKWDGSSWSALDSGMNPGGGVTALAVDDAGNLYAGGSFQFAGGVMADDIAKWNGSSWSALGSGTTGYGAQVDALALDGAGNLYVGGYFNTAGGKSAYNVAAVTIPPVFKDVPRDLWAFNYIEKLALSGITAGCGGGNYCPLSPVTRSQMAVFLERGMHGSTFVPPPAKGNVFLDVTMGSFAASFIEQLFLDGITAGCGNNKYCPNATVTRDQMAVFLLRAKHGSGYSPPPATGMFTDVPLNHWAVHWIEQLAREGITAGCGNGNYCPSAAVNRDQMAVFLVRTFEL